MRFKTSLSEKVDDMLIQILVFEDQSIYDIYLSIYDIIYSLLSQYLTHLFISLETYLPNHESSFSWFKHVLVIHLRSSHASNKTRNCQIEVHERRDTCLDVFPIKIHFSLIFPILSFWKHKKHNFTKFYSSIQKFGCKVIYLFDVASNYCDKCLFFANTNLYCMKSHFLSSYLKRCLEVRNKII